MAKRVYEEEIAALPSDLPPEREKREQMVMGVVMGRLRGQIDGAKVAAWMKEATL